MQALSHYSYHVSSGQFVLCDLQGGIYSDGAIITDPVIISRSAGTYGPTDLGPDGILNFFGHHVCNKFCHSTWTKPRETRRMYAPKASTSMVVTTQHSRPQLSRPQQPAICEDYSSDDSFLVSDDNDKLRVKSNMHLGTCRSCTSLRHISVARHTTLSRGFLCYFGVRLVFIKIKNNF